MEGVRIQAYAETQVSDDGSAACRRRAGSKPGRLDAGSQVGRHDPLPGRLAGARPWPDHERRAVEQDGGWLRRRRHGQTVGAVGARYYQITIGQNSGYYLSPNATYDRLTGIAPSKLSRRDLIADLYQALNPRGIKLMVYLPSGAPAGDQAADAALGWRNGPYPNREFQSKWEQVIREWSLRWGKKVAGWWFDGCYFPNSMYRSPAAPNFASFAAAARAGNPDAVVAFNPGVFYRIISLTPDEDFTAGEIDKPEQATIWRAVDGKIDGTRIQMLSYLGETWGMGAPRFTVDQVFEYTHKITDAGGAVTWDVPVDLNGAISRPFLDQLTALGRAMRP